MARTSHYQLNEAASASDLSADGGKYGTADRVTIDQKLWLGAEGHHHTGVTLASPGTGPVLSISVSAGTLLAGTRYYYKYALVDVSGNESLPSAESFIDTPNAIATPSSPILTSSGTGGTLAGGNYTYVLSAYKGDNRNETLAISSAFITVAAGSTNKVRITFPTLPSGADGFNIYRRTPNGIITEFLISVAIVTATPPTYYDDTGAVTADCDRTTPIRNYTSADTAIVVSLPGATPVTPTGYTWKVYRTTTSGSYNDSFLHHVVEYTSETTPHITPRFTDIGNPTVTGSPAAAGGNATPSKVILTNGAEVQGELPASYIESFPYEVVFSYGGQLLVQAGVFIWYCNFVSATIVGVRAVLGENAKPAVQPVQIDVRKGRGAATPTFSSIFSSPSLRPTIPVGWTYSDLTIPTTTTLTQGDMLLADITQVGGGATPTDRNLTITLVLRAKFT